MRQCYPQNAKLTWIDTTRRAKVFRIHQSSIKPTHATTISQTRIFLDALASNCKPDRPGTVSLREESVKGAVSSHNLKFRATVLSENSVKNKTTTAPFYTSLNKKHGTREALSKIFAQRRIEKIILQAQDEPTPLKWLVTCPIRLKTKLKQARRYAKSDSQLKPEQAQD